MLIKHGASSLPTIELNKWELPDLRKEGAPTPYNHPWPFREKLLKGGYREDRYDIGLSRNVILANPRQVWEVGGVNVTSGKVYRAGDVNNLPLTTFHEVTEILEPATLSLRSCSFSHNKAWGYLEDDGKGNFVYTPNELSDLNKRFMSRMLELNPHRRS